MPRNLAFAVALCLTVTTGAFAQSGLNGKWATDRPADPLTIPEGQRRQSVQLVLSVEGTMASGSLSLGGLGGTFYSLKDGKLSGKKFQFLVPLGLQNEARTYTIELMDENTVHVHLSPEMGGSSVLNLLPPLGNSPPSVQSNFSPTPPPQDAPLAGIVADASGAVIPGVTITATNPESGTTATVITNEAGAYAFPSLQAGKAYRVSASLPGFQTKVVADLEIGVSPVRQSFQLLVSVPVTTCTPQNVGLCVILHRTK